ncbi:odorant receptor 131-2-like [Megalops cyprinoides]|uniref:odorant receptor 131-2-like n=1 Tax=Megalops cyprinoides TaxID=118141 RepID=UPI001864198C|nr:odorant receptor 131-2-like [Megalops cyprinoides]
MNDVVEMSIALTLGIWLDHQPFILVPVCYFFLVWVATTTMNMPINLAVMALERYAAVCFPLHHSQICSLQRTYLAIAVIWLIGVIPSATDLFMVIKVESTAFFRSSVFCIRESMLRTPRQAGNRVYFMAVYLSVVWLILVFTYLKIVLAARSASSSEKTTAKKARNTVLLHGGQLILAMLTYTSPAFEQLLLTLPADMRPKITYARYYLIYAIPRALSPIIYGLRDENFRKHLKAHCFQKRVLPSKATHNTKN